ncbi:RagB/SusD family nutrient uptake outer membrane protein [Plebeiibacterium marinum]|uniref:RagB/SusD family nutrient uptake outer membrane protein n=1 Tax=Plebeiibacterium marinum TaxID=2992111 RepID=A0AAE3MCZ3_9BACT|nr:RagB/SusD family nutrient uptake outer membrane protein [Plebeiobacterium marinum]MCW3805498.1 RagB/SusD family nutrient uptake outer membrane protein [Plebeiobacterium marinum]
MKKIYNFKLARLSLKTCATVALGSIIATGCSDSFLDQDPLSFYEPAATYTTESGLKAALTTSDKHIRDYYVTGDPLKTELLFSDMGVRGKTDDKNMFTNVDERLTPTQLKESVGWFWSEGYAGIKYANTVCSYIDLVEGLDEATRNAYLGRAYFHRSFRYLMLAFQFNDVPLLTKLIEVPKINFKSTSKEAILEMITKDMEFAVEWVPEQADMDTYGMVNKGACRQLLIKCYLATGQFQKAKEQADILIDQSGFALMQDGFGSFINSGEPQTWNITRNVIWDLHRPENKLIKANKEVLLGAVNMGSGDSFSGFSTMRRYGPFWNDSKLKDPDGVSAVKNYSRTHGSYNEELDFLRAIGRGIADVRPSYFATTSVWHLDGSVDDGDLRHNSTVGNWFPMDSLKYNNPSSNYYGQSFADVPASCPDTIRAYFDFPLYKIYLKDEVAESKLNSTNFAGASLGSVAHWYIYRLAETYLLRAEANYYLGNAALAAKDVNEVRKRAKCSYLYPEDASFTIGDIMDERARELYLEEFRHVELSRVSLCLALSGQPDEWGNTYDINTYDMQEGTDQVGGSYWYQRVIHYNDFYQLGNDGITINSNNSGGIYTYKINKKNLYWPVPNSSITQNSKDILSQNFGYDGYDADVTVWQNWEDAVADESKVE